MRTRALIVAVLTVGVVGIPAPAQANFPDFILDLLGVTDAELTFIVTGSYGTTPPLSALQTDEAADDCESGAPVTLQRQVDGKWTNLKSAKTNDKGKAKIKVPNKSGKYRAKVKEYTTADGWQCYKGTSNVVTHKKK